MSFCARYKWGNIVRMDYLEFGVGMQGPIKS
jgi:hypothetical protein